MTSLNLSEEKTLKIKNSDLGNLWQNYGKERLYLNVQKVIGLQVELYNTGNVCSASLNGEKISNSKANRIVKSSGSFVDLISGEIKLDRHLDSEIRDLIIENLQNI